MVLAWLAVSCTVIASTAYLLHRIDQHGPRGVREIWWMLVGLALCVAASISILGAAVWLLGPIP